jgi:GTPase SAR1 family protein
MGADFYSKKVEFEFVMNDRETPLPFSASPAESFSKLRLNDGEEEKQDTDDDNGSGMSRDEKKDAFPPHPTEIPPSLSVPTSTRPVSIQIWDTPGRERYVNNDNHKAKYPASFSDSFFKNVDAAILVYDVSSSTSFTHVLKWHTELMERLRRMEATGERSRPLPIVIVGNKIDIFQERDTQKKLRKKEVVKQRDVLGVSGKEFRGRDYRYEYSASPPSGVSASASGRVNLLQVMPSSASSSGMGNTSNVAVSSAKNGIDAPHRNRFEISTYMGTSNKTNYLEAILNNEVYRGSYLDSLLSSEDNSHPDKDMVIVSVIEKIFS